MLDVIGGKVSKLGTHTTKTGKTYTKFCVTESRKTMDDKWGKEWYHCTLWDTNYSLADGQRVIVYGHNLVRPDRQDQSKTFNNFDVYEIVILTETSKSYSQVIMPSDAPQYQPFSNTNLEDVPF